MASEVMKVAAVLPVYMSPDLKRIVAQAADAAELPMSEWIVQIVAQHVNRPDLAKIPRKKPGRRRKDLQPV